MATIGSTICKYVAVLPALQSMANFMQSVIKQFEIFSTVLGSEVDIGEVQTPITDLVNTQITPRGIAQQLQVDYGEQKMFEYFDNFGQGGPRGVISNGTGIGTEGITQPLSQTLGLAVSVGKEFNSIFNNAPNMMQRVDKMGTSLESLVPIDAQGQITRDIIKKAALAKTVETNTKAGQMPTAWGQIWGEATNSALTVLQLLPDNLTKYQREVATTLLNRDTALSNTKNEDLVAMAQRQIEMNSLPDTSAIYSLPRVENFGASIVEDTGDVPEGFSASDEDLKYIRGVAQREAMNNYTTAQIAVDFKNTATINSDLDIDLVMNKFTEKLREAVDTCAEGVNYCV
ncbi:MAG: tape measure protein [Anaerotignaceae bacterium]